MSAPPPPEVVITEVLPEVLTYDTYLTFEGTEVSTFVVSTYLRTYLRTYVRSLRIILKYLSILQYTTHTNWIGIPQIYLKQEILKNLNRSVQAHILNMLNTVTWLAGFGEKRA